MHVHIQDMQGVEEKFYEQEEGNMKKIRGKAERKMEGGGRA